MNIRPVAIEITLPSGVTESLTKIQAETIIEQMQSILHSIYPQSRSSLLIQAAATACSVTVAEVKSKSRTDACSLARWLVWEVMREDGKSLELVGKYWGGEAKDHGTVINGLRRIKEFESQPHTWQAKAITRFRTAIKQLQNTQNT